MKLDPITFLLNKNYELSKKFILVGGNETTLMEKICSSIIAREQSNGANLSKIEYIEDVRVEGGLFNDKNIFFGKNIKDLSEDNLNRIKNLDGTFVFYQENTAKTKKFKKVFINDRDSCLIDCYNLDRDSKIKIFNEFIKSSKKIIEEDIYWMIVEKLEDKYVFLEKSIQKILNLNQEDITRDNVNKLVSVNDSEKERVFFYLLKKNREIVGVYRDKIVTNSDVNDLYYYCKYHCQLIIDCKNEIEYNKKIPIYLFKEKSYLIGLYKKFNPKKKKLLLSLISSTEKMLRRESSLSLIAGLRFILNIKKIAIS